MDFYWFIYTLLIIWVQLGNKRRKSNDDINKLKITCASYWKKQQSPWILQAIGRMILEGFVQQLAVNRILDGSTGERCGIKPKQSHHLLRGRVRTHGWMNFSEDTIKAEKNDKPCHTQQHPALQRRRLFNQGRSRLSAGHSHSGWTILRWWSHQRWIPNNH